MLTLNPPTHRGYVSSTWGADRAYRGGWHQGLDFPAPRGEPALAAGAGIVAHVDNVDNSFAGRWVAIDHGDGLISRYLHNTENLVTKGQRVTKGQQIATVGSTGTSSGVPHVHFDVKADDAAVERYRAKFGQPATGFGAHTGWGWGVPAEALMAGAEYKPSAKAAAIARGVVFYRSPWTQLVLIGAAGYVAWRLWA